MKQQALIVKVCGMRDAANILAVAALKPDYMGFIFYEKSPRFVGLEFTVPSEFPGDVKKVGVFVNASISTMIEAVNKHGLDFLQLHGSESSDQVRELKNTGVGIIKVFSIDDSFDFDIVNGYEGLANFFLFDTKGKYFGGNAERFNWSALQKYSQHVPFLLSGGISSENIGDIESLSNMNILGVDVNSGVEVSPGLKDVTKIESLLQRITELNFENKL